MRPSVFHHFLLARFWPYDIASIYHSHATDGFSSRALAHLFILFLVDGGTGLARLLCHGLARGTPRRVADAGQTLSSDCALRDSCVLSLCHDVLAPEPGGGQKVASLQLHARPRFISRS